MNNTPPPPDFIAAQLRKPSGNFAANIAANMDKTNEPLFDLTLQSMRLQGGERLLEIGFGSGRFMPKLFRQRDHLALTGVDYSPDMVSMAGMINADLIQSGRLCLQEASSEHLPFEDASFDIVFCNMVIYFWDRPEAHLCEVWRVLKPEGKFYTGFRAKACMRDAPFTKFGFTLYDPEEWQAILERNGFSLIRTDSTLDPELDVNGQKLQLESICMVAQKQLR